MISVRQSFAIAGQGLKTGTSKSALRHSLALQDAPLRGPAPVRNRYLTSGVAGSGERLEYAKSQ